MPTPSVHDPRGILAAETASLGVVMFALAGVVFALVVVLLLVAVFRRRDAALDLTRETDNPSARLIVLGGLGLPVLILSPLLVMTLQSMARTAMPPQPPSLTLEVIAHQYWWEMRYPESGIETANEAHVPVGAVVTLTLRSADVIHSFWVPQLLGKHDLTPGRDSQTWLRADQPGVYRGECAELCGVQHARMFFVIVASEPAEFETWLNGQRSTARTSAEPQVQRGAAVFAREGCINCHAIRFGDAPTGGSAGPDLTHVGSRLTLGAGILENTLPNMTGWISNAQAFKPGNAMPEQPMDVESLRALAAYMKSLE